VTLFIPKNLRYLADVTGDPGRYMLAGVRIIDLQDGRYRLEVTDGRRLLIAHGDSVAPAVGADETFAALESVANSGADVAIAAEDWKNALKMGPKKASHVGVVINPDVVTLACGEQVLKAKPVEGRFPDTAMVLPRTPPIVRFAVSPALLAELLQVFARIDPEGGVSFLWYGPGKPIGLMARNADNQFLDALLMPLS
jgi:hypothetical protein